MYQMFKLKAPYSPMGDQPEAIEALSDGIERGLREQVLLGVTGSGKTFTMANIIARVNRPTLVLAHNKTLAAQLCSEFRELFPDNAVEYFVSYYDYYQPEAYIPGKDIYIEKDALINDEIDKLRHSATSALFERRDVIIVSSVSCIYSLGDPEDYRSLMIGLRPGMEMGRDALLRSLISIKYTRNDISFERNCFRVMGDTVDIYPSSSDGKIIRVEFFGDEIDRLSELDKLTGEYLRELRFASIFPATHYATTDEKREKAIAEIRAELAERVKFFEDQGKLVEAQRIAERTNYDLEMINEIGYCSGVENYSRVFSGRPEGSTPYTLLDYFPKDYLLFIDESHVTIPQVRGMSGGDRARKENLVNFGFRLPSAFDNRPLFFDEFRQRINQVVYVSATPAEYELGRAQRIAEQLIRPTGLVDPEIEVRPIAGQVDDVMGEIRERAKKDQRVLVTTLTTKMAEDLTDYLSSNGIRVRYLHHRIETVERMEIIRDLRAGIFDVLVGINLLREGLDIPEVSLVAILDADKEGLFRSATSLIQTVGRAARNAEGKVIMYADSVTKSMDVAITETNRRREKQLAFNRENNIVPKTIVKEIRDPIDIGLPAKSSKDGRKRVFTPSERDGIPEIIERLTKQM
ncbi:MAG: excinuclease ABC subunit UvrB, partial [Clostridia bacterium]|nr:excinuclease ABC subunit UvrB [Clostridia bacterium]